MPVAAEEPSAAAPPPRPRVARPRRTRRRRAGSPLRIRAEYLALRAIVGFLAALPLGLAVRVGAAVMWLVYLAAVPLRRVGMTNLAIAFPEKPVAERRRILRASMQNLGRMAAELAHLPQLGDAALRDMVRFEDESWWQEAIGWERPTGVLILSGHFGNWELLAYAHGRRGHPVTMVHRPIRNPLVDRWLNRMRAGAGTRLVRKHHAAAEVLRALHEKQLLVVPFDQNSTRGLGVFVDFFGTPASTNAGIARIGLRADSPVVPAFIVRQGGSARHVVYVLPIMELEHTGDPRADVVRNTERLSAVFEDMVRRFPEQWLWVHKRWKTRPAGAPKIY
jgi:Kdo2-lipid IVA lauroyltransferase/acyltransferase